MCVGLFFPSPISCYTLSFNYQLNECVECIIFHVNATDRCEYIHWKYVCECVRDRPFDKEEREKTATIIWMYVCVFAANENAPPERKQKQNPYNWIKIIYNVHTVHISCIDGGLMGTSYSVVVVVLLLLLLLHLFILFAVGWLAMDSVSRWCVCVHFFFGKMPVHCEGTPSNHEYSLAYPDFGSFNRPTTIHSSRDDHPNWFTFRNFSIILFLLWCYCVLFLLLGVQIHLTIEWMFPVWAHILSRIEFDTHQNEWATSRWVAEIERWRRSTENCNLTFYT